MVTMATRMINLSLPMGLLAPLILFLILPFAEPKRGVINDYTCIDIHVDGVKWSSLVHSGKFIGSYNTCIHHIRRIYKSIEYYVQFRRMNLELSKLSIVFSSQRTSSNLQTRVEEGRGRNFQKTGFFFLLKLLYQLTQVQKFILATIVRFVFEVIVTEIILFKSYLEILLSNILFNLKLYFLFLEIEMLFQHLTIYFKTFISKNCAKISFDLTIKYLQLFFSVSSLTVNILQGKLIRFLSLEIAQFAFKM